MNKNKLYLIIFKKDILDYHQKIILYKVNQFLFILQIMQFNNKVKIMEFMKLEINDHSKNLKII